MPINRRVARFNRLVANHVVAPVLTRIPGFGTIHHRGRRSGRDYRTPVKVFRRGEDYVITLPYGPESDWVRNVIAAGHCDLITGRRRVRLVRPTLFVDDGAVAMPRLTRTLLKRIDSPEFLSLTPDPDSPHG